MLSIHCNSNHKKQLLREVTRNGIDNLIRHCSVVSGFLWISFVLNTYIITWLHHHVAREMVFNPPPVCSECQTLDWSTQLSPRIRCRRYIEQLIKTMLPYIGLHSTENHATDTIRAIRLDTEKARSQYARFLQTEAITQSTPGLDPVLV